MSSASPDSWIEILGDIELCITRVQCVCLMSEALLKMDRRTGNAFASAADELEDRLTSIRDRMHLKVLEGRAES